ncbi:hypothetical protein LJB42_001860 [Komagataella kurtzmanii]|nr:hypothetical protein LJB42_001860 [Komagataella kurtzmanii]
MTKAFPSGRVETLSFEEEYILKETWAYFLHFWGYNFALASKYKLERSLTMSSTHSGSSSKTAPGSSGTSSSGRSKKSKFRLKLGGRRKGSIDQNELKRSSSLASANDPNVLVSTEMKIHESFRDQDPKQLKEKFWDFLRHDTPDNLLLRFIRARKWDVDKSLLMLAGTLQWRVCESHVDKLLQDGELVPYNKGMTGFMLQLELGKAYIRGYDRKGRPLVHVRPKLHHASDQTEEEMQHFTLLLIEWARLFLNDPVDTCSIVFDLTDFSMSNMDYAPVKFMIKCFEAHYPESLGVLFVHKAPWLFSGIWNIIKNWLDPVVASKIHFTKNFTELAEYIEPKHIPASLGGGDDYEWEYLEPNDKDNGVIGDEATKQKMLAQREQIVEKFLETTIKWVESTTQDESRRYLQEKIALGKKLAQNYIEIDPYIRSRSIYDRLGWINMKVDSV